MAEPIRFQSYRFARCRFEKPPEEQPVQGKYLDQLNRMDYGNRKTGADIPGSRLERKLGISTEEQIIFLKKLYGPQLMQGAYDSQYPRTTPMTD